MGENLNPEEKIEASLEGRIYREVEPIAGLSDQAFLYRSEISGDEHSFFARIKNKKSPTGELCFFIHCNVGEAIDYFEEILKKIGLEQEFGEGNFWEEDKNGRAFRDGTVMPRG